MKSYSRSPLKRSESLHKYLKPGALARIRDSKINARSHKSDESLSQIALSRISTVQSGQNQLMILDQIPQFLTHSYGPRYLRRKKLIAARSVNLLGLEDNPRAADSRKDFVKFSQAKADQRIKMENSYRNCYYRGDGDFEESEVWDVEARQYSIPDVSDEKITSALKNTPSPAKTIPADGGCWTSQSSPVNIPNWTHVRSSVGRLKSSNLGSSCCKRDDYEDDDDDVKMLPPHEYISLRLARSNISCFSVLEGVGRKLKGRDLCKVRNHVLTKTGFLEASSSMS